MVDRRMIIRTDTIAELDNILGSPDCTAAINGCVEMILEDDYPPHMIKNIYGDNVYAKALIIMKERLNAKS